MFFGVRCWEDFVSLRSAFTKREKNKQNERDHQTCYCEFHSCAECCGDPEFKFPGRVSMIQDVACNLI